MYAILKPSLSHPEHCSFCGASLLETGPLVCNAGVYICLGCAKKAISLVSQVLPKPDPRRCSGRLPLTASSLISELQDFDPDCPVLGYHEESFWTREGDESYEQQIVTLGPIDKIELQPDGTVIIS